VTYSFRPLTLGELLDRTFFLYRRHFVMFVGIAAVPHLFGLLLNVALTAPGGTFAGSWSGALVSVMMLFAYFVTTVFTQAATVVAVSHVQLGRQVTVGGAFAAVRSRIGELTVLSMNLSLRIFLGFLLLVIPGVVLAMTYALAVPVAVVEETSISETLDRSAFLTKGHRGRIFVIYALLVALSSIVTLVWQVPAVMVARTLTGFAGRIVSEFASFVARTTVAPVLTIGLALMYYDERIRKEAFDLEHMMTELDVTQLSSATP
jgi:hypothetical protein